MTADANPPTSQPDSLRNQVLSIAVALAAAGGLAWWLTSPNTTTTSAVSSPAATPTAANLAGQTSATQDNDPFQLPPPDAPIQLPDLPTATAHRPKGAAAGAAHLPPHPSASIGTPQNGRLDNGIDLTTLPPLPALRILSATRRRGFTYATAELATLLRDTASAVASAFPGSRLSLGNVARAGGGDIAPSVSHNSGRDADLALFAIDRDGEVVEPAHYIRFDTTGAAVSPRSAVGRLRFDPDRTWMVVRSLLSHPAVVVQWIFIAAPLRNILLDHALRIGEPELLRARARRVLVQPTDSSPHADQIGRAHV